MILLLLLLSRFDSFTIDCAYHRLGEGLPDGSGIVLCHAFLSECGIWVFMRQVSKLVLDQVLERMENVVNHLRRMRGHLFFIFIYVLVLHLWPVVHHIRRNSLLWVSGSLLNHASGFAISLKAVWSRIVLAPNSFRQTHSFRYFNNLHLLYLGWYGITILSSILSKVKILTNFLL